VAPGGTVFNDGEWAVFMGMTGDEINHGVDLGKKVGGIIMISLSVFNL